MFKQLSLALVAIFVCGAVAHAQSPFASSRSFGGSSFGAGGFRAPSVVSGSNFYAPGSQLSYNGFRYYQPGTGMTYSSTSGYSGPDYYNFYLYNGPRNFNSSRTFYSGPNAAYGYRPGAFSQPNVFGGGGHAFRR